MSVIPSFVRHGPKAIKVWTPQDNISLTVSGGAKPSHESGKILAEEGGLLALTVKNGASTNLDIEVFTSYDGSEWDTLPYASMNLGANQTKTIPITSGPRYFKVKVTNKDGTNPTTVTTKLVQLVGR